MTEKERLDAIVNILDENQFISVKDLTEHLDVSPATIRRDIAKLHNLGRVRKVFGGIAPSSETTSQRLAARPFSASRILHIERKVAIAIEAEKLCRDGDKLIVNGGSTCFEFAKRLGYRNLSIFTNSMPLASALYENGVCNLVISGGPVHREPGIVFSSANSDYEYYASKFFLSTQGIDASGLQESHPLLVKTIHALQELADEVIVLADSSKFSIRARHIAMPLARVSTLITDDGLTEADHRMLEDAGISVIIAKTGTPA